MKRDKDFYIVSGSLLKSWRKECGYTLNEISEECGKSKSWLADIESGRSRISLYDTVKLLTLYKKDLGVFQEEMKKRLDK